MSASLALLGAWVEPTDGPNTNAYLQLANFSNSAVVAQAIGCPAARSVRYVDGDRAHAPAAFTIAPRQAVRMHPGGIRLEIEGIQHPLRFGDRLPLVVHLVDGSRMRIVALVRSADGVQSRRLRPVPSRSLRSA